MRNVAGFALTTAALFLAVIAVLIGASALFYMSTAMVATIGASRLQAWLSVRGLRFEGVAPESVTAGDLVTVEIVVWSERRIRRPLVVIEDNLPPRLQADNQAVSLPIAPAYDQPIRTQYQFRPKRRGVYRWSGLTVHGTDALGLVTMSKRYTTANSEMTVLPLPIPVSVELPHASSWGINEVESGRSRGAGIEPRGVREYVSGDPLRHIHWRSSAKGRQLLVKEFEAGSHAPAAFVLQRTNRTDIGRGSTSSFETMCGHVAYLSDRFLRQGVVVQFPTIEDEVRGMSHMERQREILEVLASLTPDTPETISSELRRCLARAGTHAIVYLLIAVEDPALPYEIELARQRGHQVVVLAYDASAFDPNRRGKQVPSATAPHYLAQLEEAGALTVPMPLEGILG